MQKLILFLTTGPTLIGWVYGVFHYKPDQLEYRATLSSFAIFLTYLVILTFINFFLAISLFGKSNAGFMQSTGTIVYLTLSIMNFLKANRGGNFEVGPLKNILDKILS